MSVFSLDATEVAPNPAASPSSSRTSASSPGETETLMPAEMEVEEEGEPLEDDEYQPRPRTSVGASGAVGAADENIQVLCRFRPENRQELSISPPSACVEFDDADPTRVSLNLDGKRKEFEFDRVFQPHTNQEDIFEAIGVPTVKSVLDGYNSAVISYGQTGGGKTYTMMGPGLDGRALGSDSSSSSDAVAGDPGLIPRIMQSLFDQLAALESDTVEFQVRACYIEVYQENIRDLLNPLPESSRVGGAGVRAKASLDVHHDAQRGMLLPKATSVPLHSLQDVFAVLRLGAKHRVVASTKANDVSSRSHAILVISVQRLYLVTRAQKTSQMFLVDLAGSEKVEKTEVSGVNLTEANLINRGLLALGQVIQALVASGASGKRVYVPYRNSRLTRLLSNTIGGNSRTSLIVNCSPHAFNLKETFATLRFASQMKRIKNRATVNVEISMAELKLLFRQSQLEAEQLRTTIKKLQSEMAIMNELRRVEQLQAEADQRDDAKERRRQPTPGEEAKSFDEDDELDFMGAEFLRSPVVSRTPPASSSSSSSSSSTRKPFLAASSPAGSPTATTDASATPSSSPTSATVVTSPSPSPSNMAASSSSSPPARSDSPDSSSVPMESGRAAQSSPREEQKGSMSDPDDVAFDLRAELRAEAAARQKDAVLHRLSQWKPASSSASSSTGGLRQLILHLICPLTKKVFLDPVVCLDGLTYERRAIATYLLNHDTSPITGQKLSSKVLIPNSVLLQQVRQFYPAAAAVGNRRRDPLLSGTKGLLSIHSSDSVLIGLAPDLLACLPLALLSFLLEFCDHRALCRVSQCSRELHSVSRDNRLWKLLALRRGFDLAVGTVRELGNCFKDYFKVKYRQSQPVDDKQRARRQRMEEEFQGVYLVPPGPPGASIKLAF